MLNIFTITAFTFQCNAVNTRKPPFTAFIVTNHLAEQLVSHFKKVKPCVIEHYRPVDAIRNISVNKISKDISETK